MKFDCGETWKEKEARLSAWHPFFAITPRRVAPHDCRWLETIERKGNYYSDEYSYGWVWEYRAKQ